MLAVAEAVGLPVIAAVFVEWVRSDERDAQAVDAAHDDRAAASSDADEPESTLWWLHDRARSDTGPRSEQG